VLELSIGVPGIGIAAQTSNSMTYPQDQTTDRIRDRREGRLDRRR
jgi:hypothetical protein